MTASIKTVVDDGSRQHSFDPGSCAHQYVWNGDGTLAQDICFDGPNIYVKTYTYQAGNLVAETAWVLQ